jgi:hypothetical protein
MNYLIGLTRFFTLLKKYISEYLKPKVLTLKHKNETKKFSCSLLLEIILGSGRLFQKC